MRNKRKNSSSSGEASIDCVEDDLGFDKRLDRQSKRRVASDIDNNLNSSVKNSFKGGECNGALVISEVVNLDFGEDTAFDMRLARRWKRSLASNTKIKPNSSGRKRASRGKCNVKTAKSQGGDSSIDDDNGDVEPDYKQYLDSLDDGNCEHVPLKITPLNIYADGYNMGNPKGNNGGEIVEDGNYYRSYLSILALEDENACFLHRGIDVDVDGFTGKDSRAEDSVGDKHMMPDASDADNCRKERRNSDCADGVAAAIDAEPIKKGTLENFSEESDDIDVNGEYSEIPSGNNDAEPIKKGTLENFSEESDDIDVNNEYSEIPSGKNDAEPIKKGTLVENFSEESYDIDVNNEYFEIPSGKNDAEPIKKGTLVENFSEESDDIDVNGEPSEVPSGKNDAFQDDDVADIDPAYDFVLKNMVKDMNVSSIDFSDDDGDNETSPNDDLDHTEPEYELFLKNIRQEGKSLVLEIPALDGISQIIRYELGDTCGVDNPATTKSSKEPNLLDETYDEFIRCMKTESGLVVYTPGCGPKVVYDAEEEDSNSSDSDVVILENEPFVPTYEIPSDEEEEEKCNKSWNRNDRWFRDEVMEILKKPFDREEFNRLLQEATAHKPMIKERDFRGGRSSRHTLNKSGKSYLEVHKDLSEQIRLAGASQPKVLNLLRGFFFWLQNVVHEVFKPWKDEQCLQVLPSPEVSRKRKYEVRF